MSSEMQTYHRQFVVRLYLLTKKAASFLSL
jgi:hypothetical protein